MAGLLKKLFSSDSSQSKKQTLADDGLPALTDSDFEFLLDQLIQGLAHGWQPDRVETFMLDLGQRGKAPAWEAWLERFTPRVLAQAQRAQQRQIGTRLIYISDALNQSQKFQRLAKAFSIYGQKFVTGDAQVTDVDLVWEYDGPDAVAVNTPAPQAAPAETESTATTIQSETTIATPPEPEPVAPEPEVAATESVLTPEPTTVETEIEPPAATSEAEPVQAAPTEPVPPQNEALQTLFNQGLMKADQGDFTGAIADWDQVLTMNNQIPQVWHNRGSALGCLGKFDEALASFDQAIKIAPDSVVAWKDRSYALMKLQRWQEALDSWNHTIELRDDVAEAWFQRGYTLEQLQKADNARINYQKAIALEPDFNQAKERLAVLQGGKPKENPDPWS